MIVSTLSDALQTLKQVAKELNTSVDKLSPAQLKKHYQDCFINERLQDKKEQPKLERVS